MKPTIWLLPLCVGMRLLFLSGAAHGGEAPKGCGWRGDGSGCYPKASPPLEWDGETKKHILWSTRVGPGKFSSPILVAGKAFVLAEPSLLVCVDATSGNVLWQRTNGFPDLPTPAKEKKARGSPGNATPTPVSDGRFVYVSFGCGLVGCYTVDGQRQWLEYFDLPAGPEFGRSSSPLLAGDRLLVSIHHLMALDARTGKLIWKNEKVLEHYGTPAAVRIGDIDVVLSPSGHVVRLKDGAILGAIPELQYESPLINGPTAYFVGSTTTALEFITPTPDTIEAKPLWKTDLDGAFFASPVWNKGLLFVASNEGNLYIIHAGDGHILETKELDIPSASGRDNLPLANLYPSLSIAGGHLFLSNDLGDTLVLEPGREYKELHKNHLLEGSGGTPAFAGGRIYVRDGEYLFCIGEK